MKTHKLALVALALVASLVITGCANPVQRVGTSDSELSTLTITIPSMAIGLGSQAVVAGHDSRVFATVNSAELEIFNASNTSVFKKSLSLASNVSTVSAIPPGTGYTVKLKLFNTAVSSTVPTVLGTATGVNLTSGATSALTITCVPYQPSELTGDDVVTLSQAKAEKYFRFNAVKGTTYVFFKYDPDDSSSVPDDAIMMGVFDQNGSPGVDWTTVSGVPWTAPYTGDAYVGVYNGASTSRTPPLITRELTTTAVGQTSKPTNLYPGYWDFFAVGQSAPSYVKFTTNTAATYQLDMGPSASYTLNLYAAADFTGTPTPYSSSSGVVTLALDASTTYYATLQTSGEYGYVNYGYFLPVLPANGTYTAGSISAAKAKAFYVANVDSGASYTLNWADSLNGPVSPAYTLNVDVTALQQDVATTFFQNQDVGYPTGKTIVVPSGQTKVFFLVRNYAGGSSVGTFALKLTKN